MGDEETEIPAQSDEQPAAEHHPSSGQTETNTVEVTSDVLPQKEENEKVETEEPEATSKADEAEKPSSDISNVEEQKPAESEPEEAEKRKSEVPERGKSKSEERTTKSVETNQPVDERKPLETRTSKGAIPVKEERPSLLEKETKKSKTSVDADEKKAMPSTFISSESLEKKHDSKEAARKTRSEKLSSKAKNVVGSTIDIRRLSTTAEFYDRTKGARFMNTYKLDSDNPFNPDKVQKILEAVMVEALENLTYDPEKCPKQAKWASSAIRAKVKELQFDRYKLICLVTIGEKNSQDILVTCRFLWDVERDRYASYCIENTYVYGIALCFGIYYE